MRKLKSLNTAIFAIMIMAGLSGCSGSNGGTGGGVATRADLVGSWSGTMIFHGTYEGESGAVEVAVASDGTITGSTSGTYNNEDAAVAGSVAENGQISSTFVHPSKTFTIDGTLDLTTANTVAGTMTWTDSSNTSLTGPVTFSLSRTP